MVEYVDLVKVIINVFTAVFACISLSFTLCVCVGVIRNSLLGTVCSVDEHVLNNKCTQCPAGSKQVTGDKAMGPDTTCEGKRN